MRILHLCLACFYIDGYNYQENVLPRVDLMQGHDVMIIASTETYIDNRVLGYVEPADYYTQEGIHIVRLPYKRRFTEQLSRKIRAYQGLYQHIREFDPDIIFSHDLCFESITDVIRYLGSHPRVRFFADTHTSALNSGRSWISLCILHKMIYRSFIKKALPFLEKYFYIGLEEKFFSVRHYHVPEAIMDFFPLGGIIPSDYEYNNWRKEKRMELGIEEDRLLFIHSGKLNPPKRTVDLLQAFISSRNSKAYMIVVGSIATDDAEYKKELEDLLNSSGVMYLGWKSGEELRHYLCAADVYCQPGSVSATLQQAICCGCVAMTSKHSTYEYIDSIYHNFLWAETQNDIQNTVNQIIYSQIDIAQYKKYTIQCATELLDYKKIELLYSEYKEPDKRDDNE